MKNYEKKHHDTRGKQRRAAMKRMGEENATLRLRIAEMENEMKDLKRESQQRRSEEKPLQAEVESLRTETRAMKRQMKTEREELVETKSLLEGATSRCAALIRKEAVLKRTNEDLGIQIRGMRENVKNHKLQTADLQLQLKKLEEENKEHIEEKRYEYDLRSNLENDVEDLKRSISLKDKEIADLKRMIGEQNQSTDKQSDASGEEVFHSDGTADEHSQEDDESEYYGTYSESSNEAHGNPSKKVRTDTIKSHFREVLANKSRDKIGSSSEDKNNGLSAKNISLRSTRTRKLQLVYERYSSRTSRHLIKVISSFGEPMNFVAYIDRVAFAKGEVGPNASAGIGLSDRRLRENPRAQYIRVEAHNQEEGKRGVYVSMQVPRLQVNSTVHK